MPDLISIGLLIVASVIAVVIVADLALDLIDRYGPAGRRHRARVLANLNRR
jgi:hypothetical protein